MIDPSLAREHDDVTRLAAVMNRNADERAAEKRKRERERELDVDESIPAVIFYCGPCGKDFTPRRIFKEEDQDWNRGGKFRYWKARHRDCGTWCKRLISDKAKDPFWRLSPSVKRQRALFKRDVLQPHETGFNMLYGKKQKA